MTLKKFMLVIPLFVILGGCQAKNMNVRKSIMEQKMTNAIVINAEQFDSAYFYKISDGIFFRTAISEDKLINNGCKYKIEDKAQIKRFLDYLYKDNAASGKQYDFRTGLEMNSDNLQVQIFLEVIDPNKKESPLVTSGMMKVKSKDGEHNILIKIKQEDLNDFINNVKNNSVNLNDESPYGSCW